MKLTIIVLFVVFVAFVSSQMPPRPLGIQMDEKPRGNNQERDNDDKVQGRSHNHHDRSDKSNRDQSFGKFDFPSPPKQQVENFKKINEEKVGIQISEAA